MTTKRSAGRSARRPPIRDASRRRPEEPRPRGRPKRYCQKIVDKICDRLADGVPLTIICRDEDMPAARTVRHWQTIHPDFLPVITASREAGADALCDLVLSIVNAATPATVNVARLKFDGIRWLVSKIAPRKYGDRIATEVSFQPLLSTEEVYARYQIRMGDKKK
jgi:hypothetical protein